MLKTQLDRECIFNYHMKTHSDPQTIKKRHETFSGKINKNVQKRVQLEIFFFEIFKVNKVGLIKPNT